MKLNIPPFMDLAFRVLVILIVFMLSLELDQYALGMMSAKHSISTGLGVSLLLGGNIIAFFICYELYKSTQNKHYKNI
jgi:ABC-type nickel/cobalt efflux system permease component RcnA